MDNSTERLDAVTTMTGTQQAAALAWSSEELPTQPAENWAAYSWHAAVLRALLLLLVAAASAGAIAVIGTAIKMAGHHQDRAPSAAITTTTVTAAPVPQPIPPSPVMPPPAVTAEAPPLEPGAPMDVDPLSVNDHRFLAQLDRDGVPAREPGTDGAAVVTAKAICKALVQGVRRTTVVTWMDRRYLTEAQSQAYLEDAVVFYCPHAE